MTTIIKAGQGMETSTFRLHYFPDIPFECARSDGRLQGDDCLFEHIDFNAVKARTDASLKRSAAQPASDNPGYQNGQVYEKVFQQGQEEGFRAGLQQVETTVRNLSQIAAELRKFKQDLYRQAESDIIDMALAIGKKVLNQEIKTNHQAILPVVQAALKRVTDHSQITIRINPADLDTLKQSEQFLTDSTENSNGIGFEADDAIGPGGCIIETNFGEIDARLDQQFQAIAEALQVDEAS
jgi:flagellar assembly protein FliH